MYQNPQFAAWCSKLLVGALLLALAGVFGCAGQVMVHPAGDRPIVDRRFVEYPTGMRLETVVENLSTATAITVADDGLIYVADHGGRGQEVRILQIDPETGSSTEIYPRGRRPLFGMLDSRFRLYGPVGGLAVAGNELFASARDERGDGLIVAFDLSRLGSVDHTPVRTVVGELPARGDHSVTDLAMHPTTGRLYFGLGSATNSGVVGVDNWQTGWLRNHPTFHDRPLTNLKIGGYRFDTEDPEAGPLNPDKVNTAPFNPFRTSNQRIKAAAGGKPGAAIYSVSPEGGDLRVEAHGLRNPRGLAFNEFANLYASNQGMELRGTRPVKDDPDVVIRIPLSPNFGPIAAAPPATWFGWPDYSADLMSITESRFQPPAALLGRTGYRELSPLIDYRESDLEVADRETLLSAVLPSLSGASGMTFVPDDAGEAMDPYKGMLVLALRGDRAPFATSDLPLLEPVGYKFVVVDPDRRLVRDFIYNIAGQGRSRHMLDRPVDAAVGPDGSLYLLDMGEMRMREGRERYKPGTGRLYRLAPLEEPDPEQGTAPAED